MSSSPDGSIDQGTADLILKLQLEDAGVYLESCIGKSKDPTDAQVAFELQREDLQATRSGTTAPLDNTTFAKPDYPEPDEPESSAWAAGRKPEPVRLSRCVACQDEVNVFDIATLPCGHEYCRSCVTELFELSLTNESLFPPRCCRATIDLDLARIFLTDELVQGYEKKKIEFETPDRTYCHSKTCSAFIPPAFIKRNVATCPQCRFTTCKSCKARAHTGDCPTDTELKSLLDIAKRQGWQRCFSCWRIVELLHGCNHIT
ncbi:hypothetical protein BJX65DRAFT_301077 [Aspergillus insuetus]